MIRKYATAFLILISLSIGEVHTFWEKDAIRYENWIYSISVPMSIQWNIKFLTSGINSILIALALLLYQRNRFNKSIAIGYFFFTIFDILLYFYNYKTSYKYSTVYAGFGLVSLVAFYFNKKKALLKR
jgi:hypothetical protein